MPRRFDGAAVAVSGAGGGLGRALALRFAREGSRVALLDRDAVGLDATARAVAALGVDTLEHACDVTDASACGAAVAAAVERFGRLDVLVNNAGITHRSPFATTRIEVLRRVVEVNLFGAIQLTQAALPHLKQARGLIVTISSVAGFSPLIARTGYAASKHALHGFFDSLRTELAPDGVDVTLACPAFVATGIERNALGPTGATATHPQVVAGARQDADAVADRIVRAARRGRRLVLVGRTAHAAWWLNRFAPAIYERVMARRLRDEMR